MVIIIWLFSVLILFLPGLVFSEDTETSPFPGVRYIHRKVAKPRKLDMHIVFIDLNRPGVQFKTTKSNGNSDSETDLERTSQFVKRCKAQIGINGGFFSRKLMDRRLGVCNLSSLAVSDGEVVSPWGHNQTDAVNIGPDNSVAFLKQADDDTTDYMTEPKVKLYNAIAGNVRLIKDGRILAKGGDPTYPQTAVGHTADHHLVLFVSDGRQPKFSAGMTYEELAKILKGLGAVDAIAFDGGGSATMVMTDPDGEPKVLNRPSDGSERYVGNNLAVIINRKKDPKTSKDKETKSNAPKPE
jgi:exopolysaccharide biosynthesis protein